MIKTSAPPPATSRLSYERIRRSHAPELQHALCDPRVYACISVGCPPPSELEASFARKKAGAPAQRANERRLDYAVRHVRSGEAIGRLEATVFGELAEVPYLFGADFWGHGYASEGLAWLHDTLRSDYSVSEFWAAVRPGNTRSMNLLERAGYNESAAEKRPQLTSYDPGDRVFYRPAKA